ncbi:PPR CONTAINING PLANT-LIKE PROTEIN [Salix koriyanagi]|uniref:PPR CONTAINING PLANT-LIKE PROTEIN n=1 Tax=Salix koriyanagi TaxID=2511006 RepID=A0A9Q0ZBA0_9ROSI|nr:PPR CONTAINING PLANT-LIKE PROTEIN [Salix koriyanagi]
MRRSYFKKATTQRNNLYSRISPFGDPRISLAPVLDQWAEEGKKIKDYELRTIVKGLRARKRFKQALEVSQWMSSNELFNFSPSDHAVRLDLIGKKMKELGFVSTALNYNDLMCLYVKTGLLEKVPDVLSDMKENGISPDLFSYRICLKSYGERSEIDNVEKILREMESQSHISMDWITFATVANIYLKAGLKEKALVYLKKCEEKVNKNALGYNHLISLYASLGNKDEMMRSWELAKANCKKQLNRDYIIILGCLVKLGHLEEAEKLLQDWESSCQYYDFQVPNVVLIGYSRKGLPEKAEAMLQDIIEKQKMKNPSSWSIIAAGYMDKQNMEKAFECMKAALAAETENKGWRPKPAMISNILNWVGDNVDAQEVEAFVGLLETKHKSYVNQQMVPNKAGSVPELPL